jgi:hydroxyacylglutathione hydrolase
MNFQAVRSVGLAHTSYYMSDKGDAFVVDPRRDTQKYLDIASEDCSRIKYVFETHRNEDYLIGSLELQDSTGAEICHSSATIFRYGEHSLDDGDSFKIGRLEIMSLWTPGHTIDSMCYVVSDIRNGDVPLLIFTGDTLFMGDVGRTDLLGKNKWEKMSRMLYDSLHGKVLTLGDSVALYPAHTAGSICGSRISDREISTIGYERRTNPLLTLDKENFVKNRLNNDMPRPPYFRRMEEWNLNGSPLLKCLTPPELLSPKEFNCRLKQEDSVVLDTRQPDSFAGSHIPGSISIWIEGSAYYTGLVLSYNKKILLVCERPEDANVVTTYLRRIGFDDVIGYLCPGMDDWRNKGYPAQSIKVMHVDELRDKLKDGSILLLDVRDDYEWSDGHVEGSQHIFVGDLQKRMDEVPKDRLVCTTCGWGGRGGLAASILKQRGYQVANLLGGIHAWESKSFPLVK